jgi:hypothetical protein
MTIDCVYYTPELRCYRNGDVERLFRNCYWRVVENTANDSDGYNEIKINGKTISRHRIIAFCFLGLNDIVGIGGGDDCIDHINGIRLDNRVVNLRITTHQGNNHNYTRAKGYCWNKPAKKWRSHIHLNNKQIHLGYYDTEEDARQAYLTAKEKYHIH